MFSQVDVEKRKEELQKFGVFFDDDYDYLQHMKDVSQTTALVSNPQVNRDARSRTTEDNDEEKTEEDVYRVPVRSHNSYSCLTQTMTSIISRQWICNISLNLIKLKL